MTWRLIDEDGTDVYQNLAVDETVARFTASQENKLNTLRFWRSNRAVVIGRFQCVHKEVNLSFCEENKISIARRFTGGGAVYHDLGNLNFSICADRCEKQVPKTLKEIYEYFVGNVSKALKSIDIPTQYDPVRSCIRIRDLKITGTAGWLKRGVAFLHGTLLINSDLPMLRQSLSPPEGQPVFLRDKTRVRCMDSKRDHVTTIADQVKKCPSVDAIKKAIAQSIEISSRQSVQKGSLSQKEKHTAQALYQSRYSQSEWNLGTPAQGI
ncbi:MAG: lipoate--protein ligase family protein [Candidatus Thorarchaeota archaeon]|nr:lipoate--protein ligase family protein [Candidatus Thorarchaeota archaeon]